MTTSTTRKSIPFKSILIDPARNHRQDTPRTKELAESLKANGLLYPLIVSHDGTEDKPYVLRGGFRRAAAWLLNGWQGKDIDVTVREYKKGDAVSPVFDGIIDNKDREDVSPLDTAEAIYQLTQGTYPVGEGETAEPVDKKVIAERLDMKPGTINNFLRVFENLDPDVAKKCRKAGAPLRLMVLWAGIAGKGRTDDDKAESRAALQSEAFEEWHKEREALETAGRKKKPRKVKSKGGEGEGGEGGGGDSTSMVNKTKTSHLEACIAVLKLKAEEASASEKGPILGRIEALRFVTGDLKRLPGVTQADLDAMTAEDETEEESDEEEGEEEGE